MKEFCYNPSFLLSPAILLFSTTLVAPAACGQAPSPAWDATPVTHSWLDPAPHPAQPRFLADLSLSPAALAIPEAPSPQLATNPRPARGTDPAQHIASKATMVLPSDWHAQPLSAGWKARAGIEDLYSFESVASYFLGAGYEHLVNEEPNYGTNKEAFGKRLGAGVLRNATQAVFTDAVFAPILKEDPRYYVEGPNYSAVHRTLYSITRPLVTRKDDGSQTINGSLLLGYAAAAAITPAYYPQSNRNFHDVASVYGGSIGGAALGYFITEFSQDALRRLHLQRLP